MQTKILVVLWLLRSCQTIDLKLFNFVRGEYEVNSTLNIFKTSWSTVCEVLG